MTSTRQSLEQISKRMKRFEYLAVRDAMVDMVWLHDELERHRDMIGRLLLAKGEETRAEARRIIS